ncbi:MAG TPA: type II secretion system F family protein [Candidatus Marinimicrobia bacterium]|nr:type II secretion system F family protein [Candidatus Neomarinimicrobiota bacterium]
MPNYTCKVMDSGGAVSERSITAASMIEIYRILDMNGEQLITAEKPKFNININIDKYLSMGSGKLSLKDLNMFTRQLQLLLNTGIPMLDALDALERAATTSNLKKVVKDLKTSVTQGESLSAAMAKNKKVFSNFYVNMVKAGEASGTLPQIFEQMRVFATQDIEARQKMKKAIRYPIFVISAIVIAAYVQIAFVMPKMASTLLSDVKELPLPTKIMLGLSEYLSAYGVYIFGGLIFTIALLVYLVKTEKGAYQWDLLKLNLPLIGSLVQAGAVVRFTQILNTLVSSGVKIVDALAISSETVDNRVFEKILKDARQRILEGDNLSMALEHKYMPEMAPSLVGIGERTGALGEMLDGIAEYFHSSLEEKMETIQATMEPVLTLVIAVFVGIFVMAVFLPMIENMTNMM